jgi:hypothetical protein
MMDQTDTSTLWCFEPTARPDDPRWLDAKRHDRVLVRADTLGEAV